MWVGGQGSKCLLLLSLNVGGQSKCYGGHKVERARGWLIDIHIIAKMLLYQKFQRRRSLSTHSNALCIIYCKFSPFHGTLTNCTFDELECSYLYCSDDFDLLQEQDPLA